MRDYAHDSIHLFDTDHTFSGDWNHRARRSRTSLAKHPSSPSSSLLGSRVRDQSSTPARYSGSFPGWSMVLCNS